jgi:hypothetical protein
MRRVTQEHRRDADGDHTADQPAGEKPRWVAREAAKGALAAAERLHPAFRNLGQGGIARGEQRADGRCQRRREKLDDDCLGTRNHLGPTSRALRGERPIRETNTSIKLAHELPGSRVAQLRTISGR